MWLQQLLNSAWTSTRGSVHGDKTRLLVAGESNPPKGPRRNSGKLNSGPLCRMGHPQHSINLCAGSDRSRKWTWGCSELSQHALKIHPTNLLKPPSQNNSVNKSNIKWICPAHQEVSTGCSREAQLAGSQQIAELSTHCPVNWGCGWCVPVPLQLVHSKGADAGVNYSSIQWLSTYRHILYYTRNGRWSLLLYRYTLHLFQGTVIPGTDTATYCHWKSIFYYL